MTASHEPLRRRELSVDPFEQFGRWFGEARDAGIGLHDACTLATADGAPSARMVLLKGFDRRGFVFFTNYGSRKARELDSNPRAALCFYWKEIHCQVRMEGTTERTGEKESAEYFGSRPHESRLSAWASNQSEPVESRAALEERMQRLRDQYPPGSDVPLPPHWGGYRLEPCMFEFWREGPARLHDRFQYTLRRGLWVMERLSP